MKSHLSVIRGDLADTPALDPTYWLHPVHGVKAAEQKARESVAQAFGDQPYGPLWAVDVLKLAVDGNPKARLRVTDALEMLAAHFSVTADDCNPHGMERLFPEDIA